LIDLNPPPSTSSREQATPGPGRRPLVFPLLILLVAMALWWWGSKQESRQDDQVRQFVTELCEQAAGRPTSRPYEPRDDVDRLAIGKLGELLAGRTVDPGGLWIVVGGGEEKGSDPFALRGSDPFSSPATHSAMIHLDGQTILGLRLALPGDSGGIRIVGYWVP
jgi:hypothetical protein